MEIKKKHKFFDEQQGKNTKKVYVNINWTRPSGP